MSGSKFRNMTIPRTYNNFPIVNNITAEAKLLKEFIYESYWNCQTNRRPRQGCYSQGNPPYHAYPRRRPVTDYIDTVGAVLLRNGGFSEATGVVRGTPATNLRMITIHHFFINETYIVKRRSLMLIENSYNLKILISIVPFH